MNVHSLFIQKLLPRYFFQNNDKSQGQYFDIEIHVLLRGTQSPFSVGSFYCVQTDRMDVSFAGCFSVIPL